MPTNHHDLPIDPASTAKLAEQKLRMTLVDTDNRDEFEPWTQAAGRGFLGGVQSEEQVNGFMSGIKDRRTTGVYDDTIPHPALPVATVDAFETPLTVPGQRDIPAWGISMVTVSPTHRRRGIARELLESELRTAVGLGLPMAMLTVSESTIYGRFGFSPAALAADLTFDTNRLRWTGPIPDGRVHYVPIEDARKLVDDLRPAQRLANPGEIEVWPRRWDQILDLTEATKELKDRPRTVRYDDADGVTQGFLAYKIIENEHNFAGNEAELKYFVAQTPDAYAALWRFLLELDLVSKVTARLSSVDEPVRWLVNDFRAIKVETYDHQWLRILDVKACLEARAYFAPLDLTIEVQDDLCHAAGTYRVQTSGSSSLVELPSLVELVETTTPDLVLTVNDLSAIYLGGVSAGTLAAAGRIRENTPGAVAQLEAAFHSPTTPYLSVWY